MIQRRFSHGSAQTKRKIVRINMKFTDSTGKLMDILFPLDDMPQGIFIFDQDEDNIDSGIYDDREVSN
jgi:hypothetical protein